MKRTIKVKDLCGEFCIDENDISQLAKIIVKELKKNNKIELDFQGVDTVLTAFFNGLMGELFEQFDYQVINKSIIFEKSTSRNIKNKYEKSLENAKAFYSNPAKIQKNIRRKIDTIFKEIEIR